MEQPLVSIIIPCRNYSAFVEEAICSALNQTYPNIEIVAVDDGSTDNSLETMRKYPIKVVEHPYNMGLPFARNTAIRESSGELIIPLDADDQLQGDYAKLCVEGYQQFKDSRIGIIRTGLINFTSEGMVQKIGPLPFSGVADQLIANRVFVSAMFPKSVWEEVGGYS
jgi:glycosyltransferase involved in cell wall biosynthesis